MTSLPQRVRARSVIQRSLRAGLGCSLFVLLTLASPRQVLAEESVETVEQGRAKKERLKEQAMTSSLRAIRRIQAAEAAQNNGNLKEATRLSAEASALANQALLAAESSGDSAAVTSATSAAQMVDTKRVIVKEAQNVCGRGRGWGSGCFYIGAFLASASMTTLWIDKRHNGQTSRTMVSAVIPTAGFRLPIDSKSRVSLDFGALTGLISKDLTRSKSHKGCRDENGEYESHLPCVGNVAIDPLAAVYAGITFGTEDLGLLTLMPMVGIASTSLDGTRFFYTGFAVGLINVNKILNFGGE